MQEDIPTITKWNEKGVDTEYYLSSVLLPYNINTTKVINKIKNHKLKILK